MKIRKIRKIKYKNLIKLILLLLLCVFIIFFLIFIFKNYHDVKYNIKIDYQGEEKTFEINEIYKDGYYHILINNNDKKYIYNTKDNYFKGKKIIKEITNYQNDDISCIAIKTKKDRQIICNDTKQITSSFYYKDKVQDFINDIYNINNTSYDIEKISNIKINKASLDNDQIIYLYTYNAYLKITNKKVDEIPLFSEDIYINDKTIENDLYIFMPNYEEKYDYKTFYVINKKKGTIKKINSKDEIAKDFYINGLVDNKVYIFDRDSLIQYEIDLKKLKIKEVGNKNDGGLYYDGSFTTRNIYDFRKEELKFQTDKRVEDIITSNTSIKYLKKENDIYYYLDSDNNYYLYDSILNEKMLILHDDIKTINKSSKETFIVKENKLYRFDGFNLIEVLEYEELNFNDLNRIFIYEKA